MFWNGREPVAIVHYWGIKPSKGIDCWMLGAWSLNLQRLTDLAHAPLQSMFLGCLGSVPAGLADHSCTRE
eukprot:Skav225376  [mRNA]  locus=scaffold329:332521:332730:+ [translate_table: standard]